MSGYSMPVWCPPYPRTDGRPLRGPALWRFRFHLVRNGFWFGVRHFQQWAAADDEVVLGRRTVVVDGLAGPQTWARFWDYERHAKVGW